MSELNDAVTQDLERGTPPTSPAKVAQKIRFRGARPEDGAHLHHLVELGGVLELNTTYSYVLMADHFASTTVVAERMGQDGELQRVGFVTAYRPPSHPDTVFVWQIGVHPDARGQGVARGILQALVRRPGCRGVRYLEATVTPSNAASRRLFESFAKSMDAPFAWKPHYDGGLFGSPDAGADGEHHDTHEPEDLFRAGPFLGLSTLS